MTTEAQKKASAKYYQKNVEKLKQYSKDYRNSLRGKELYKEYAHNYYLTHKDEKKQYELDHLPRIRKQQRESYHRRKKERLERENDTN